jgi:hypothetical protein
MTLKEYLELEEVDRKEVCRLIDEKLQFDEADLFDVDKSIMDIETYFEERLREREKITTISWPEKLSKKESVICRLKMMLEMLGYSNPIDDDASTMKTLSKRFILSVIKETFQQKTTKETKWPGLDPDGAKLLNHIYAAVYKLYEKKFKI